MANGQLTGGVAVRVSALCLDRRGRVADWTICGPAVRGGLLLDLALIGRIEQTAESIVVDETPTGFGPADRLLAAIGVEPERSLDSWLDERRIGLRDLVEANETSGRWHRRRLRFRRDRYEDRSTGQRERDLSRTPLGPTDGWTPEDACVTAVAAASGLLDRDHGLPVRPPAPVVAAADAAEWLCAAVADHLYGTACRLRSQARGMRVADTVGPG
ncbi:GPP34 family phosphoprotein [Geodermatophilus sp. URMC 64]